MVQCAGHPDQAGGKQGKTATGYNDIRHITVQRPCPITPYRVTGDSKFRNDNRFCHHRHGLAAVVLEGKANVKTKLTGSVGMRELTILYGSPCAPVAVNWTEVVRFICFRCNDVRALSLFRRYVSPR
jgi:hypothetical protein